MAELEPAELFAYGIPRTGSSVASAEVRNALTALAQTFYTTDNDNPTNPRQGQLRFNDSDITNRRLQVWLDNAWVTLVQIADSTVKQIVEFPTSMTSWTVDHNLGSQPLVQVYDSSWNQLVPALAAEPPNERHMLGYVPPAILTALSGTQNIAGYQALNSGFVVGFYLVVTEDIVGSPDYQFDILINGSPVTGGVVTLNAVQSLGTVLTATAITADNKFVSTDLIQLRSQTTNAAAGGGFNAFIVTQRNGFYYLNHVTPDRVVVTHPEGRTGYVVLVG